MNLFDDLTLVKIKNQEKQREEKRLINNLEQQEKFVEMESAVMENQESFFRVNLKFFILFERAPQIGLVHLEVESS